ncbi:hypothetical protein B0T16DRAFT_408072 [Cercophora newfieldiana]|uniref:Azaphilone pigments biosynthesis cluster protein L N-terminal domain-containing protein n=1 Tax=Cercophora newfieldiana TaxID=92897 RepID=A0AA40CRU4_9PEZI|nr:hypothetical protein B0T16DRAFT_408072 [Cercophora newfieldiana]
MDPLSITASCLAITAAVTKTATAITVFVRSYRDALQDLGAVSGQLTELRMILDQLREEGGDVENIIPSSLNMQILSILGNCDNIMKQLDDVMLKYRGRSAQVRWALFGKDKVQGLSGQLGAHISALHIALEVTTLAVTKAINEGVNQLQFKSELVQKTAAAVHRDTGAIKEDTTRIIAEIQRLRISVQGNEATQSPLHASIEQYLESVTEYTESVCGDSVCFDAFKQPSTPTISDHLGGGSSLPNGTINLPDSPSETKGPRLVMEVQGQCCVWVPHSNSFILTSAGMLELYSISSKYYPVAAHGVSDYNVMMSQKPPKLSPDGSHLALIIDGGDAVYLIEVPSFGWSQRIKTSFPADMVVFSPNNKFLVITSTTGESLVYKRDTFHDTFSTFLGTNLAKVSISGRASSPSTFDPLVGDTAFASCGRKLVFSLILRGNSFYGEISFGVWDIGKSDYDFSSRVEWRSVASGPHFVHWHKDVAIARCYAHLRPGANDGRVAVDVNEATSPGNPSLLSWCGPPAPGAQFCVNGDPVGNLIIENGPSGTNGKSTFSWTAESSEGKGVFAICLIPGPGRPERSDWEGRLIIWDSHTEEAQITVEDKTHKLWCPQLSSDLKYVMVKLVGTKRYQIWEI